MSNFLVFSREESFNFSNSIGLDFKIKLMPTILKQHSTADTLKAIKES
jgi:hypothetical protein